MTALFRFLLVTFICLLPAVASAQQQAQPQPPETAPAAATAPAAQVSVDAASEALIKLLEDPQGRAALIEQIRGNAAPSDTPATNAAPTAPASDQKAGQADQAPSPAAPADGADAAQPETPKVPGFDSFAVQLGEYTKLSANYILDVATRAAFSLKGLALLATGDVQVKWAKAKLTIFEVSLVLASALALFWAGQKIFALLFLRGKPSSRIGSRAGMLLLSTIVDVLTVILGWGAGYAAALLEFGILDNGISLLESLALNAFLITGLVKAGLRFIFAPHRSECRLLPFGDETAIYWYRQLGFVVALLGYGIMLGVPAANMSISFVVGNALRVIVLFAATLLLLALIRRNRDRVSTGLKEYGRGLQNSLSRNAMFTFARFWHWFANLYVLTVLAIWLSRPFDAIAIILRATGLSILTIMASFALTLLMTRTIIGGIRLPLELRVALPALETRLNAFVPRILKFLRFIVLVVTILLLLQIWSVVDVTGWFRSEAGAVITGRFGAAVFVLLICFAIWLAVMSWVDIRLREQSGYIVTPRVRTLFQLFRNAFTVLMVIMGLLLSLSEIGVDIGPLIAGAGVVGLAISFGAQTLVKDIITGAFIQIENGINEGDVVTVAGITGTVERLTVRSVRVRDLEGTTHIVPFSSVDMVSNFMRDFSYHVSEIGVAYDTDIGKAKNALLEAFQRLKQTELGAKVIDDYEMHGVTMFGDSAITIRSRIKTMPGDQWAVGRAFNEYVKQVFDECGIEIPFPQVTYHAAGASPAPAAVGGTAQASVKPNEPVAQLPFPEENGDGGSDE